MFPLWQVSFDTQPSNGSTHWPWTPTDNQKWWADCNIQMQILREKELNRSKGYFTAEFKGTVYVIDLVSMTQLNTYKGVLRKLRRLPLYHLQDGSFNISHVEVEFMCDRAHKMRRKY